MTSFKSGSGDLDFGSAADDYPEELDDTSSSAEAAEDDPHSDSPGDDTSQETSKIESTAAEYPYFVRRSNVTDERDQRIELHLRPEVSGEEAAFRNELATALETDTVPKTDAREFALKFAFQHPEQVAELMRDEGFGVLD
jgi:hypothetical protein